MKSTRTTLRSIGGQVLLFLAFFIIFVTSWFLLDALYEQIDSLPSIDLYAAMHTPWWVSDGAIVVAIIARVVFGVWQLGEKWWQSFLWSICYIVVAIALALLFTS